MAQKIDLSGNDLVIGDIYYGASTPASAGTLSTPLNGTTQTIAGAKTFSSAITPTGGVTASGGFTVSPRTFATGDAPAMAAADGTDATPSVTETYVAELFVPANCTATGVAIFNGSATGSGNVTAYICGPTGAAEIGHTASTAISGTDTYQLVPFTATKALTGPATYYVYTQYNNTSSRFNTHVVGSFGAGKYTSTTYGTFPVSTPPTTFTTGLGPIANLY